MSGWAQPTTPAVRCTRRTVTHIRCTHGHTVIRCTVVVHGGRCTFSIRPPLFKSPSNYTNDSGSHSVLHILKFTANFQIARQILHSWMVPLSTCNWWCTFPAKNSNVGGFLRYLGVARAFFQIFRQSRQWWGLPFGTRELR